MRKHELVFAEGPAGTGKTWLAVGHAVSLLEQGLVERLILSRPAVEAGERLGFLPGDMKEKVDPYLRPIYDALYDFMDARMVERGIQTGMIEIAPLAFMRGRTLSKAAILLDEAQNATAMQMKMFLTRLGEGSRMMVNGDPTQTDLAPGQKSGLSEAIGLLVAARAGRPCALPPRRRRPSRSGAPDRRGLRGRQADEPKTRTARGNDAASRIRRRLAALALGVAGAPLARETIAAAVARERRRAGRRAPSCASISADDAQIRELNARWRGLDKPTNVLSFPAVRAGGIATARLLGDVVLAFETVAREAAGRGKSAARPLSSSGRPWLSPPARFDHERTADAERMEALETRILARLGVADPYRVEETAGSAVDERPS